MYGVRDEDDERVSSPLFLPFCFFVFVYPFSFFSRVCSREREFL